MPTVYSVGDAVTLADKRLLRAYPRIVKELTATDEKLDRLELDGFLKLLPGAVERFESSNDLNANSIEPSVLTAIENLVSSFGSRNAVSVDTEQLESTSNTDLAFVETGTGVGDSELPNGSDTDQSVASSALPHNDLQASAGNSGEPDSPQAGPRNPRVRTTSKLLGKRARGRARRASGESADDRGRLSESEGGSQAYVDARRQAESRPSNVPRNAKE